MAGRARGARLGSRALATHRVLPALAATVLLCAGAQAGDADDWTPLTAEVGTAFARGEARLRVLPLAEVDRLVGADVSGLGRGLAFEQIDYAMNALGLGAYVSSDRWGTGEAGAVETPAGPRAFAAEIRQADAGPMLVVVTAPPDKPDLARAWLRGANVENAADARSRSEL